jgi:hypothetical protein
MKNLILALSLLLFTNISFGQSNPYDVLTKPSNKNSSDFSYKSEFAKQFPKINIVDWKPGMKFMTEPFRDKSGSSSSQIDLSPYKSKDKYPERLNQADYQWKTFIYRGLEQRNVDCPRGTCQRTYLIFDCEGVKYESEFVGDTTELRNAKRNFISKLVYLDEVDKAKELLVGKTLYIITRQWFKDNEKGIGVWNLSNPIFIPVIVTSIGLGTQDGPCKIVFKQINSENETYLNVRLSGINKAIGVFGIDFDKAFQFDDPKSYYPSISDDNWTIIQTGGVKIGMTKQECELSWEKPKSINKNVVANEIHEQWVYSTSKFLYFKNGILESIQN